EEIFRISSTPDDNVSIAASGEARKQTEVKLIGKLQRFQTLNGNVWEDALRFSARLQNVFASGAPEVGSVDADWKSVELRNDAEIITSALGQYQAGVIDQQTYLELVASVYNWDSDKINEIIERTQMANGQGAALTQNTVATMLERLNSAGLGDGGLSERPQLAAEAVNGANAS
ncbi:MAG TPA: hypothetical protein VKA67_11050, partial [Verrucomicrobiae bacterium]|nr:hypothetical protein [Verrucomicrobiae bacterium]